MFVPSFSSLEADPFVDSSSIEARTREAKEEFRQMNLEASISAPSVE